MPYGHLINNNCDDLGCMSRSFIDCKLLSILRSTSRSPSAIAELLVSSIHHLQCFKRHISTAFGELMYMYAIAPNLIIIGKTVVELSPYFDFQDDS